MINFRKTLIFHIPHSRTLIPDYSGYNLDLIDNECKKLVDFATDEIFYIENTKQIIFPYNRIYCDVERLDDSKEEMFKCGRGFFYTHTDDGQLLRLENNKPQVYEIYKQHHKSFLNIVQNTIKEFGKAAIIDCHSFADIPFNTDLDKSDNRPDICLGVDKNHSPDFLIDVIKSTFEKYSMSVEINSPYSGTIVPLELYGDNRIYSIMIEINRKLYMPEGRINYNSVYKLNKIIKEIFNNKIFDLVY